MITVDTTLDLRKKHKLSKKDHELIIVAYTKAYAFNGKRRPCQGTPAEFRSDLFEPMTKEYPRQQGWYKLTKRGEEVLTDFIKECPFPKV